MFDKLIDFLISIIELFRFFWIVRDWERAANLRFGRYTGKIMQPGFHFIWPMAIDEIHTIDILPNVIELDPQTIVTNDRVVVVIQAIVKYEVSNPETCLLKVGNEIDALKEFTQGAIHTIISKTDYNGLGIKELEKEIIREARKEVNDWGIKMHSVTIKSYGKMSTIRLMQ